MSSSRLYQVTAIVLRSHDYGEGNRLISLFTREEGKIVAVAKGVRKPRAKLAAALQHFTLGEVHLAMGRRFDVITQVHVLDPFYGLRKSIDAFAYGSYFAELFDESLEERQRQPALFDLLVDAYSRLARGEAPDLLARYVEISLIAMLGYQPYLLQCAHCQSSLARPGAEGQPEWPTWLGFSAAQGGALCPECMTGVPGAKRIAAGTVQVAQLLLHRGAEAMEGLKLSDRLRREIAATFREYLEYRLERQLHSARFLREWEKEHDAGEELPAPVCSSGV
ncbi:MAG: DNA repair protein RecO [Armatimonadota bacterium]